ncbi:hypothetical protein [Lysinibacillus fusiformis]|uniref:hypothetical protein n=1 Tax=Lysinibacillus fusiformis TaxID=28031 RepID=UPI003D00654E
MIKAFFSSLSFNEGIAILALVVSTISVVIAVISAKLTQRSIEEANRPYVVATIVTITTHRQEKILMIKNYGNIGATIDRVEFSEPLSNELLIQKLSALSNTFIAPNQSIFHTLELPNSTIELVGSMEVEYRDYKKKYKEVCTLNSKLINVHLQKKFSELTDFENKLLNAIHNQGRNNF